MQVAFATGGSGVNDLLLTFTDTTDSIIIWNTLEESNADEIEQIVFDDSTIWTMSDLRERILTESQTDGNDDITGYDFSETLEGGLGNDELHGLDGSDTYVFNRGDGQDKIEDNGYKDTDKLVIHGYTPDEVNVSLATGGSGTNDLLLTFLETTDSITVWNTLEGSNYDQIEQIIFDDGTIWSMADVNGLFINGTSNSDTLVGTAANDTLSGFASDDRLEGSVGNDFLIGGAGNDTFVFKDTEGADTIRDFDTVGNENIELHVTGIDEFADLSSLMTDTDAGTVINFGNGDSLTLTGVLTSQLSADHFEYL